MITSFPEVEAVCGAQFESAKARTDGFLYSVNINHYDFGNVAGKDILFAHDAPDAEPLVVLDIGAGEGMFLSEIQLHTRRVIHPIGLTAAKTRVQAPIIMNEIQWVYGDIQRPHTWQPQDVLRPESVDVAVSLLTFRHLVDPLRALHNAIAVLKPGGDLFVEQIRIDLPAHNGEEAAENIKQELRRHEGEYGFKARLLAWEDVAQSFLTLYINDAHFRRRGEPPAFETVLPKVTSRHSPALVYDIAPAAEAV